MLRGRPTTATFGALAMGTGGFVCRTRGAGWSDATPCTTAALDGRAVPRVCWNAATAKRTDALATSAVATNFDTTAALESASSSGLGGGVDECVLIPPPGAPRRATSRLLSPA